MYAQYVIFSLLGSMNVVCTLEEQLYLISGHVKFEFSSSCLDC